MRKMEVKELLERVVVQNEMIIRQDEELLILSVPRGKSCKE